MDLGVQHYALSLPPQLTTLSGTGEATDPDHAIYSLSLNSVESCLEKSSS